MTDVPNRPSARVAWHQLDVEETLAALGGSLSGLAVSEVGKRLAVHGPNALPVLSRRRCAYTVRNRDRYARASASAAWLASDTA